MHYTIILYEPNLIQHVWEQLVGNDWGGTSVTDTALVDTKHELC